MSRASATSIRALVVGVVSAVLGIGLGPAGAAPPTQSARPNIIFLLTDDLDAASVRAMPRVTALLADRGVSLTNFFVTTSLCCPSRSSLLRGQYVHNHQVLTNRSPSGGFERFHALGREDSTVAVWLQNAGYRTALMGKYLNGYPGSAGSTYVPQGWDEWDSPVKGRPYGNFDYTMNENGRLVEYGHAPGDYLTDVLSRKAVQFIRSSARDGRPFFLYLATYAPHAPSTPAPRHAGAFAGATAPRPPSFNEEDTSDKPEWVRQRVPLTAPQIAQIDEQYRQRLRSLLAVDDLVADLVAVLRETGRLEQTYLFFTSDNGYHMGEHRLMPGKNTAYEEDIRVPLIVRGPGVPARRIVDQLAMNIDVAPTFASLAGAAVPPFVDGRSLVSLLGPAPPPQWRQAFLTEHFVDARGQAGGRPGRRGGGAPAFSGLRTRDAKYVEYATGERELYDLRADPYELRNLAATAPQELLSRLAARLAELRQCGGRSCRKAEDEPVTVWAP